MIDAINSAIKAVENRIPSLKHKTEEPMKNHTSFRIGGPVRVMFFPESIKDTVELYGILFEHKIEPLIIGNGTNLLVDDKPLNAVAVKTTGLDFIERTGDTTITAGAGAALTKLAVFAYECGLSGLEFVHGIPGSLGGAVSMNSGAYGGEMKDVVYATTAYKPGSGKYTAVGEEHSFSHRRSRFSDTGDIVLSSDIRLQKAAAESIKAMMDEYNIQRREKQPLDLPSAGSVFKRPKKGYSAALIEQAGLKGYTVGGAQISEKHAGFIVNRNEASFYDVITIIGHIQDTVLKKFSVELELEVKIIGGDTKWTLS